MQQAMTYRERSHELLAKARAELDTDPAQAGEKGWGAAASIIKAVAEQRGVYHRTHRSLSVIVESLERETGDVNLGRLFDRASALHQNFYENLYDRRSVEIRLRAVQQFVERVEALLNSST